MTNRPLIAGNWKMNGRLEDLDELAAMAAAARAGELRHCDLLVCPPATLLSQARAVLGGDVLVGGQDCHAAADGPHTGDISAEMLRDLGASHVIVGHSERRADHGEDDRTVSAKTVAAWRAGLAAVVCIGETEAERDAGETLGVLGRQLSDSLPDGVTSSNTVIAYEPVWAIGTGRTPTTPDVAAAHAFIRQTLVRRLGEATGSLLRILYGGSVKPSNARLLMTVDNVDGALVGGASLKAADLIAICGAAAPD